MDVKYYQNQKYYKKKKGRLKNNFLILTITFVKKKKQNNKAFTRSDQLSPFLINVVSTLPVHPVSLEHLAVVLIHKEMSLQEFNWFLIFLMN